jgi:hypothetical protein
MSFVLNGRAWKTALEPNLQRLWDRYFLLDNQETEPKLIQPDSGLSTALQPKYHLKKDIAELTGTK